VAKWLEKGGKKHAGEKSYKFFREGYVFDVYVAASSPKVAKSRCYRSLKKNEEPHFIYIYFKDDELALVEKAHCSCVGGSGGHCNHVFALLFQLNDYFCLGFKDIPSNATCTSRPQSWHIPRAASIVPLPVMGTHFAKAATDDRKRQREPVRCKLYDARGPSYKSGLSSEHVMRHVASMCGREKPPPFSYLLSDQEPSYVVNTVLGNVPVGSPLSYQLQDFGRPNTVFVCNALRLTIGADLRNQCTDFPELPIDPGTVFDEHNLTVLDINNDTSKHHFDEHIMLTIEEARSLEKRTVLQGECPEWLEQHKYRLTASNFAKVVNRVRKPTQAMLRSLFEGSDLSRVRAIAHGRAKEKTARSIYAKKMQKSAPTFAVFDAGLSVSPAIPYLGASPDGKVYDPIATGSKYGLLEIKCPFSKRGETLDQAAQDPDFYLFKVGNSYKLKLDHNSGYYNQVQGQLAITGLRWCDFCVFLSESNEMSVDRIVFDQSYWNNELLPKLTDFFLNYALPFQTEDES